MLFRSETVASLVILDANAPDPDQDKTIPKDRELLADLVAVFEELAAVVFGISRQDILEEPHDQIAEGRVMEAFQTHGVLFSQGAPLAELRALVEVYRTALLGHQTYRAEGRIQAPIHLFHARERGGADGFVDLRPAWGWQDRSASEVMVAEVPGTHVSMMAAPHVEILAMRLRKILSVNSMSCAESLVTCDLRSG